MTEKFQERAVILSREEIAPGICSLWIGVENIASHAKPGQFLSVYCDDESRLLPRPISVCEIDRGRSALRLVYRIAGAGTAEFSGKKAGDSLRVVGPLGNGFLLKEKKALLVGGGIGIPPLLELAKQLPREKQIVLGYRDSHLFLEGEFQGLGEVFTAIEDGGAEPGGRLGGASRVPLHTRGTVLDAITGHGLAADILYACGPAPMLRALKRFARERDMECRISLEERMACGIGACLSCVCPSAETDAHTHVKNKRVCREGPVFDAREVEL